VAALRLYIKGKVFRALITSARAGEFGVVIAESVIVPVKVPMGGPQGKLPVED
jgi:hypothetical protein